MQADRRRKSGVGINNQELSLMCPDVLQALADKKAERRMSDRAQVRARMSALETARVREEEYIIKYMTSRDRLAMLTEVRTAAWAPCAENELCVSERSRSVGCVRGRGS